MTEQMQKTASELRQIIAAFTPQLRELSDPDIAVRPAPKKWARKEILGHLIDSACNNQQKLVRMMQEPELVFPGYKQDDWVDLQNWAAANWQQMVDLWQSYNQHIAYLIGSVDPKFLGNKIRIEDAGPFALEFIMPEYVEHLKHHIRQIFPEADLDNKFVNVYGA